MSNVLNNTTALKSIKDAWNSKLSGEAKFETHIDNAAKHMRWTDTVSPTKNNLASGKSTASPEGYTQLKELFEGVLKAKKRAHDTMAVGSAIKDLKNALMLRQAPELFNDTGGNLGKIEAVDNGKATLKETKPLTTIQMRDQLVTNLKNWIEKNKDDLGDDYVPTRKAILSAMETLKIKR
jgi:hypothetical protein